MEMFGEVSDHDIWRSVVKPSRCRTAFDEILSTASQLRWWSRVLRAEGSVEDVVLEPREQLSTKCSLDIEADILSNVQGLLWSCSCVLVQQWPSSTGLGRLGLTVMCVAGPYKDLVSGQDSRQADGPQDRLALLSGF